jgi:hypothetical protein
LFLLLVIAWEIGCTRGLTDGWDSTTVASIVGLRQTRHLR